MGTRTFNQLAKRSLCKDEMNLAEFPLAVIGKRPPQGIKTLQFSDEIKHPETGETIYRSLTVTGSDLLGLPTSIDEEVLVGCLKLTKDEGMQHRKVPFTPYQFLEELGWSRDGKSYRRLTTSLDRWTGTLVISNNAFWHKGKQKLVKDSFGLIDRWKLTDEQARPFSLRQIGLVYLGRFHVGKPASGKYPHARLWVLEEPRESRFQKIVSSTRQKVLQAKYGNFPAQDACLRQGGS